MTKITYIPGEIANAAIDEHGNRKPVTRTQHIFDDSKGKSQAEVNADIDNTLTLHQSEINALDSQNYLTYKAEEGDTLADILPAIGAVDTIYRVGQWDGTQYVTNKYSEYAWKVTGENTGFYQLMDVKNTGIDITPTKDSHNLVESGGVRLAIDTDANVFADGSNKSNLFIKEFYIIGAPEAEYTLKNVRRNYNGSWLININVGATTVASYNTTSENDYIYFKPINNSGISAEAIVDWSVLDDGISISTFCNLIYEKISNKMFSPSIKLANTNITNFVEGLVGENAVIRELYIKDSEEDTHNYSIGNVRRNVNNQWLINIYRGNNIVSTYNKLFEDDGIIEFTEVENSGVKVKAIINWNSIPIGTDISTKYDINYKLASNILISPSILASENNDAINERVDVLFNPPVLYKNGTDVTNGFIKELYILGLEDGEEYYVSTVRHQVGDARKANMLVINRVSTRTIVCQYAEANVLDESILVLGSVYSTICAIAVVDWSVIEEGTAIPGLSYTTSVLNNQVISDISNFSVLKSLYNKNQTSIPKKYIGVSMWDGWSTRRPTTGQIAQLDNILYKKSSLYEDSKNYNEGEYIDNWQDYYYARYGSYPVNQCSFSICFPNEVSEVPVQILYDSNGNVIPVGNTSTAIDHTEDTVGETYPLLPSRKPLASLDGVDVGWSIFNNKGQMEKYISTLIYYNIDYISFFTQFDPTWVQWDENGDMIESTFWEYNKPIANFMQSENKDDIKFCIMIGNLPNTEAKVKKMIKFLYDTFAGMNNYLTINGQPVFFSYNYTTGVSYKRCVELCRYKDIFLVCDGWNFAYNGEDAKFGYASFMPIVQPALTGYEEYDYDLIVSTTIRMLELYKLKYNYVVAPILMGRGQNARSNFRSTTPDYSQPTKTQYATLFNGIFNALNKFANDQLVLIYSFSEYSEGGWLMPTQAELDSEDTERNGWYKLQSVKDAIDKWKYTS